jgi:hypothetical protein
MTSPMLMRTLTKAVKGLGTRLSDTLHDQKRRRKIDIILSPPHTSALVARTCYSGQVGSTKFPRVRRA